MSIVAFARPIFDPAGRATLKTTNNVQVLQSQGMHDTAIITLRGENMTAPELLPGTPVQMLYGNNPTDIDTFYGYIDHINTHYDYRVQDTATMQDVVCLGVSYALKDSFVGTWSQTRASSLVQSVIMQYQLAGLIQNDDFVWPQLASTGDSAWSYLNQLADKVGYVLACNKGLLRFTSVDVALRQNRAGMPVFETRNAATRPTITRFQTIQGEAMGQEGHDRATRTVTGINPDTGDLVGAVNTGSTGLTLSRGSPDPFFIQQVSDQVVTTSSTAQALLTGIADENRFQYQATATLSGLTSVTQGTPIVLSGIDNNSDGVWWVEEVVHKIRVPGYTMDVLMGRDGIGDTGMRPVQQNGVAYSAANPFAYALSHLPPTILVNQRWRSASQFNVYITGATR